jgi:DNA processing protein
MARVAHVRTPRLGRQVILTDRVVAGNEWAQKLIGRPGVHVAGSVAAVLDVVEQVEGKAA